MTGKERRKAVALINDAWARLRDICEARCRDWPKYMELNRREEREHRHWCPDHVKCGLTVEQAARQFAMKQLLMIRLHGEKEEPKAAEFFCIRQSIFGAWALAVKASSQIASEFSLAESQALVDLDYAELNKDPRDDTA